MATKKKATKAAPARQPKGRASPPKRDTKAAPRQNKNTTGDTRPGVVRSERPARVVKKLAHGQKTLDTSNEREVSRERLAGKVIGHARTAPVEQAMLQSKRGTKITMARSYVRGGVVGRGKQRGKNYQTTVSFTPEQIDQVVAAATFRGVSLSEMIRACVIEHLNKGLAPTENS